MPAKLLRLVFAFVVVCALISTVSAIDFSEISKLKGYNRKLMKKTDPNAPKPEPKPLLKRAAATSSACTTSPPPNPTAP